MCATTLWNGTGWIRFKLIVDNLNIAKTGYTLALKPKQGRFTPSLFSCLFSICVGLSIHEVEFPVFDPDDDRLLLVDLTREDKL